MKKRWVKDGKEFMYFNLANPRCYLSVTSTSSALIFEDSEPITVDNPDMAKRERLIIQKARKYFQKCLDRLDQLESGGEA